MATTREWVCPGCGKPRSTRFCPSCGEEPLRPRDLKIDDIATRIFSALSSVDGKLLRSFRALLKAPGMLSEAYVQGQRRSWLGPLQLFIIANAVFFAVQSWTHLAFFSSPLDSHLHNQDWQALARQLTEARLAVRHETLATFAPTFDRAALLNAKALIILMALAFAPFLPLLFPDARRAFGAHVVFALHFYAFVLLVLCVSMMIAQADTVLGGGGLAYAPVDITLSLFNLGVCAIWLFLAVGRFYGSRGVVRVAKVTALTIAIGAIALAYRFTIFLITLYTA
jgi:hypothetical protein